VLELVAVGVTGGHLSVPVHGGLVTNPVPDVVGYGGQIPVPVAVHGGLVLVTMVLGPGGGAELELEPEALDSGGGQ
jgi:hypothetical protein